MRSLDVFLDQTKHIDMLSGSMIYILWMCYYMEKPKEITQNATENE